MPIADFFVGLVGIALGGIGLWAAAVNSKAAFALPSVKSMERVLGRLGVRIVFALAGVALIVMGCAVIAGFAPGWLSIPELETS